VGLIRNYSVPLLLALLLHLAVAGLLLQGWVSAPKTADVIKPKVVNASLIVMQERRKPQPIQKPKPKPKAVPAVKKVEAKPEATPQPAN
jgi:hypothetical protein